MRTVAVYSQEDRFSLHRYKADEAFLIGPADGGEPVRSYLNMTAILDVAAQNGVDAIHPGYGFLSENAAFARLCAERGFTFIGPRPEQLDAFGDKVASKRLARKVGVPTVPGSDAVVTTLAGARKAAKTAGYPVMVKASFGGGGRGMRMVERPADLGCGSTRRNARRARHSVGPTSSSNGMWPGPSTSRCRCSATGTAGWSISGNATARCNAGIRRWSRWRRVSDCRRH